ncbi:MAG: hypothetical protein K0M45_01000 [Candidatus Paracaedibacteraceae bacterium]|nr:hypothetical protein [Candidatus Paracaedibacteraceae bacterium]
MKKLLTLSVLIYAISLLNVMAVEPNTFDSPESTPHKNLLMTSIPPLLLEKVPQEILKQANLTPEDLAPVKAAKLIRLGLWIQSLPGETLGAHSSLQKNEWTLSCFSQASNHIEEAQRSLPTADYFVEKIKDLLPPTIKAYIPAEIIISADITRQDSLNSLAYKLNKLGRTILNLEQHKLAPNAPFQKTLAAHCFMYAGKNIENWLQQQGFQLATHAADLEQAATLAQSYYQLAADNFNDQAAQIMKKKIEKLEQTIQAAKYHQLFSALKTGFSSNQDRQSTAGSSLKPVSTNPANDLKKNVIKELKSVNHQSFIKQTPGEDRINSVRHFFPLSAQNLSNEILGTVGLAPHDSPYKRAFKIVKLAMNIRYTAPPSAERDQILSDCYRLAGDNLIEAIRLQREKMQTPIAPELLMDTALSAAQFYTWAAPYTVTDNSSQISQAAHEAFHTTIEAVINIPEENYDWRVMGDKTLREVILINLAKIIHLFKS